MAAKNSPKGNSSNQVSDDALAALHNLLGQDTDAGPESPRPQPDHAEIDYAAGDPLAALMNAGRDSAPPEPTCPSSPATGLPQSQVKPTPAAQPVGCAGSGINSLGKSPLKPSAEPSADTLSASGFVSMLAKAQSGGRGKDDQSDAPYTRMTPPAMPAPARPQPVAPGDATGSGVGSAIGSGGGGGGSRTKVKMDPIREAREISMTPIMPSRPRGRGVKIRVPGWYHSVLPIMFTMATLLVLLSVWAVMGSVARIWKIDNMPLVPNLNTRQDFVDDEPVRVPVTNDINYYMPFVMLLTIPVAFSLVGMAIYMKRRIALAEAAQQPAPETDESEES